MAQFHYIVTFYVQNFFHDFYANFQKYVARHFLTNTKLNLTLL